jgi:hypothetical protein
MLRFGTLDRAGTAVDLSGTSVKLRLPTVRCAGVTIGEGDAPVLPRLITCLCASITISERCVPVTFGLVTFTGASIPIPRSLLAVSRRVRSSNAGSFYDHRCRHFAGSDGPLGVPVPLVRDLVPLGGRTIARIRSVVALVSQTVALERSCVALIRSLITQSRGFISLIACPIATITRLVSRVALVVSSVTRQIALPRRLVADSTCLVADAARVVSPGRDHITAPSSVITVRARVIPTVRSECAARSNRSSRFVSTHSQTPGIDGTRRDETAGPLFPSHSDALNAATTVTHYHACQSCSATERQLSEHVAHPRSRSCVRRNATPTTITKATTAAPLSFTER